MTVSIETVCPEGTKDQSVPYHNREALGKYLFVSHSKHNMKSTQQFDPGLGDIRECKSRFVASLAYIILYGGYFRNIDM